MGRLGDFPLLKSSFDFAALRSRRVRYAAARSPSASPAHGAGYDGAGCDFRTGVGE